MRFPKVKCLSVFVGMFLVAPSVYSQEDDPAEGVKPTGENQPLNRSELLKNTSPLSCIVNREGVVSELPISNPEYFISPNTSTGHVAFISNGRNFLADLETGKSKILPGSIDPVFTPDGRYLTLPGLDFYKSDEFLGSKTRPVLSDREMADSYQSMGILSKPGEPQRYRAFVGSPEDEEQSASASTGTHESNPVRPEWLTTEQQLGLPARSEFVEGEVFEQARFRIRDYVEKDGKLQPLGPPRFICKNIKQGEIPRISKDGRFVATKEGSSMKIFEILDSGECRLVKDLGFLTGKVDFSPDGKRVLFHSSMHGQNLYVNNGSNQADALVAYEYHLENDSLNVLDVTPSGSSYYPSYIDNNHAVFVRSEAFKRPVKTKEESTPGSVGKNDLSDFEEFLKKQGALSSGIEIEENYKLVKVDLNRASKATEIKLQTKFCGAQLVGKESHSLFVISRLFYDHCQNLEGHSHSDRLNLQAQMAPLTKISKQMCLALLNREKAVQEKTKQTGYQNRLNDLASLFFDGEIGAQLTDEDLKRACEIFPDRPNENFSESEVRKVDNFAKKSETIASTGPAPLIPPASCMSCHANSNVRLPQTDAEWIAQVAVSNSRKHSKLLDEVISRLTSTQEGYAMPGSDSQEARDFLTKLQSLKSKQNKPVTEKTR